MRNLGTRLGIGLILFLPFFFSGGCGSSDNGGSGASGAGGAGGGTTAEVCGISCSGTVNCGAIGTAEVKNGTCLLDFPGSQVILSCDHTLVQFDKGEGGVADASSFTGSWSGSGTSVSATFYTKPDAGSVYPCTITP